MTRRLRLCLVAAARFPVREPFMGGLEAHTHALARSLRHRGHDVTLFAGPGSDPRLDVVELPVAAFTASEQARSDVGASPEAWMQEHHAYLDLMLGIADGRHGPFDAVHNNSLHHLPVAMSAAIEPPVVTTLHTPPVPWLESAMTFAPADHRFVAVSEQVARAWSATCSATVIHNGVDTDFWTPGPGGGTAFWAGRIVPEKAPHLALLAARRAEVPLDLAGPVHDRTYFTECVAPLLGPQHRYLGHLGSPDLREAFGRAAVVLVTPDWDEPFGLVAAEAMSCGTPVAGFGRGGVAEIVSLRTGALAPAGDVDALADAIRSAARLDRHRVRRRIVDHFSHERMVERYEQLYLGPDDEEEAA